MNTLVNTTLVTERVIETERNPLVVLLQALVNAFAPVPRHERTADEERTLRRELWMLGGQ